MNSKKFLEFLFPKVYVQDSRCICKVDRVKLYQDSDFGLMNAASHHLTQQDFDCSFKLAQYANQGVN